MYLIEYQMILIHFGIKRGKYCVPFNGLQN